MKFEIGAALGLGAELTLDIDASGAIEAVCDFGEFVADEAVDIFNTTSDKLSDFLNGDTVMHIRGGAGGHF